jgi:hypothetical protein
LQVADLEVVVKLVAVVELEDLEKEELIQSRLILPLL